VKFVCPRISAPPVIDLIVATSLVLSSGCSKEAAYGRYAETPSPVSGSAAVIVANSLTGVSARLEPLAFPYQHDPLPRT
jgi:hypothetical protein